MHGETATDIITILNSVRFIVRQVFALLPIYFLFPSRFLERGGWIANPPISAFICHIHRSANIFVPKPQPCPVNRSVKWQNYVNAILLISHKLSVKVAACLMTITVSHLSLNETSFNKTNNLNELINILTKAEKRSMIQNYFV